MGEIADDIIEGYCCQICGEYFEEPTGYPTTCDDCKDDDDYEDDPYYNPKGLLND